jgi:hypothetical protein
LGGLPGGAEGEGAPLTPDSGIGEQCDCTEEDLAIMDRIADRRERERKQGEDQVDRA